MKKSLKTLAVSTVLTLSVIAVAGCSSQNAANTSSSSPTSTSAASEAPASAKPMEVTVALWDVAKNLAEPEKDELLKTVQQKTNLVFKPEGVTWNDYKEKFNLWAASKELPDMFVTDFRLTQTVDTWVSQGLIKPIPDDLSKYPNLQKLMDMPDVKPLKINGKFYFIPRLSKLSPDEYALERGLVVRKDWMDKLGVNQPTTFEEYKAMFKAFAEKDPDGNGKADTIGLTHNFNDVLATTLGLGSSVPNLKGWIQEDGKWIPSLVSKGMADYMSKFKQLYDEGALDKDFAILKVNDGQDKFAQGNVGALAIQINDNMLKVLKDKWDKANPEQSFEDSITIMPVWTAPDGNTYRLYDATAYTDIYFSAKVDDTKMDAMLKMLDFNLSEEGKDLYSYGFEGENYKKENGKVVPLETKIKYPSNDFFFYLEGIGHSMNVARDVKYNVNPKQLVDMAYDKYDWMLKNAKPIPKNFNIEFINTPAKSKFNTVMATYMDDITKIILAKEDPKAQWEKQIKIYESKGLNEAIAEVNDIAAKQGIQ